MKKNMGGLDRMVRLVVAVVLIALSYFNIVEGTLALVFYAVSAIFILTSLISFCPLYTIFGIKTCKM